MPGPERNSGPAGCGAEEGRGYWCIIPSEGEPGNAEGARREANIKLRKEFGERTPRLRIPRRVPAEAQEVAPSPIPQPVGNKRKERRSDPGPEVSGVSVGGINERSQGPGAGGQGRQFGFCKRQEGSYQTASRLRGDARQTGRSAPAEDAQQNRLYLIILMMRGHDVPGVQPFPGVAQPRVARFPGLSFRRIGAEVKLGHLERNAQVLHIAT